MSGLFFVLSVGGATKVVHGTPLLRGVLRL